MARAPAWPFRNVPRDTSSGRPGSYRGEGSPFSRRCAIGRMRSPSADGMMRLRRAKPNLSPVRRGTMLTYTRNDAIMLLRAVNSTQSHGHVGARVYPAAAARAAWLEPGTERYDEALWYLLWQGALAAD